LCVAGTWSWCPGRCPQAIDRGAQAVARGGARGASQVLYRRAQAVARGAATLSQQEKNNSADVQRSRECYRLYLQSCTLALAAMYLRLARVAGRCYAAALAHVSTIVVPPAPAAKNNSA